MALATGLATTTRITVRVVETIQPGEIVWDNVVRGFGLRCQRSRKIYVLKASIGGRVRWFSIGEHGTPWTPDTARKEAQIMWGKIRDAEALSRVACRRHRRRTWRGILPDRARAPTSSALRGSRVSWRIPPPAP